MKILFCHGLEGSPRGRKATTLRDAGHEVVAPVLPKDHFEAAVRSGRAPLADFRPDVLVGSSRGGAVAMRLADASPAPLVLLAPAGRPCGVAPAVRRWQEAGLEGWLCPALFRYFERAPERLYVEVRADDSG